MSEADDRPPDWTFNPVGQSPEAIREEFGARLAHFMRRKGWTQSELARQAGTGRGNINRYIAGKMTPRPGPLRTLASVLEVDPNVLMPTGAEPVHPTTETPAAGFSMSEPGQDGRVRLTINMRVPQAVAWKVAAVLAESGSGE